MSIAWLSTSIDRRGPRSQTRTFPSDFDQLARIRQFVGEMAAAALLDDAHSFDLKVAVSEASANAIEHGVGKGDLRISVQCRRHQLIVTVCHPGGFRPRTGNDPTRVDRGMGLPLMLALTDEVTMSCPQGRGTRLMLSVTLD
jgi:anti-sigma regulatory factor (Ser/Thr protein kinase)